MPAVEKPLCGYPHRGFESHLSANFWQLYESVAAHCKRAANVSQLGDAPELLNYLYRQKIQPEPSATHVTYSKFQ